MRKRVGTSLFSSQEVVEGSVMGFTTDSLWPGVAAPFLLGVS